MADDQSIDPIKLMQAFLAGWNQDRPGAARSSAPTNAPDPAPPAAPAANAPADGPAARLMAQALALANMPSRDDVTALGERLDRVEALLAGIACRLDRIEADENRPAKKRKKKG